METSRLPVYNAARELYLQIVRSTQKCPVNLRRGRIAELEEGVLKIMDGIAFANDSQDVRGRLAFIAEAQAKMRSIEVEMRCIFDLGFLRKRSFAAIIRCEDKVTRQLAGWEKRTLSDAR